MEIKLLSNSKKSTGYYFMLLIPVVYLYCLMIYLNISGKSFIYISPCFLYDTIGVECPGCGATRCICSILTFNFEMAIKYNIVFFVLFFIGAFLYLYNMYYFIAYNRFLRLNPNWLFVLLAILLVFSLVRNFGFFPVHLGDLPSHTF